MDRHSILTKLETLPRGKIAVLVGSLALVFGLNILWHKAGHEISRQAEAAAEPYLQAFRSAQAKVDDLRQADEEREKLRLENAHLRLRLESSQFECRAKQAQSATMESEEKLLKETGSRIGRGLASINYKPPGNLSPSELFTLGVYYFKIHDDEKAAVIFSVLNGLEDNDLYKTPKSHMLTGIAWYRLENYEMADTYFDKVLNAAGKSGDPELKAQAILWKAVVAERAGQHARSQSELRHLIEDHPHSMEAGWVNSTEANRVPANR